MKKVERLKPASEGEEFIEDFFYELYIEYECEKKIEGLKNDGKRFRMADFYLPKFNVYVEFFGLWNNTGNEEYKLKKEVYRQNNIPCVYIYPENLGIIHYTFDKRLQKVLEDFGMKKELRKYRVYKFFWSKEFENRMFRIVVSLLLLGVGLFSKSKSSFEYVLILISSCILIYQSYYLYHLYADIFKRNKYSLDNMS